MSQRSPVSRRGQVLPIVVIAMMVLMVLVPLMVFYTQTESRWSVKQAASTRAFHLAESGIEKGYLAISESTNVWTDLQSGTVPADYRFDKEYSDIDGGTYAISISSGPGTQQATILSVGRDSKGREVRAIEATYSNSPLSGVAIYAGKGAQIGNGVNVEWGAILSPNTIDAASRNHPQFWSATSIISKDTNPDPPNCDSPNCCQWHAYQTNLPPAPSIDLDFYKSSATASSCPTGNPNKYPSGASPAGSCYWPTDVTFKSVTGTGQTVYVNGNLTIQSPGIYIQGNLLVTGNVILPNGVWGNGSATMGVPSDAWKQYCNDWSYYKTNFDTAAPAAFPGLASSYAPTGLTYPSSKLSVNGLLYVGGNFNDGGGGGGNSDVYGALYALGSSTETANSPVNFYFNADAASNIKTTSIILTRTSWRDSTVGWPSGLP
ncbi:MAG: hypothetical protein KGM24_14675 [Elusimicrobia bacterium]|nr:hypothetical protein [Elusimicrobiota bacterium]